MKKIPLGPVATARTAENVERVRERERGHREECNPFCSATWCRIRNERKHSKANLTQKGM